MLESLLAYYGYPLLFFGTFLEGETILILGGVAAHLGYLSLGWVIACGFFGTLFGDQLYFYLGRRHGKSLLARFPSWQGRSERVFDKLKQHQNLFIISFRFLYGLRTVTPFAIGISNVTYLRFTVLNLIGAGIWANCIGLGGYYFSHALEEIMGDIKKYEIILITAIIGLGILVWLVDFSRRRLATRITPKKRL